MAEDQRDPSDETVLDYVAGRLPPARAAEVEAAADASPELAAEIALMRGARAALAAETDQGAPGALGWARLDRALDRETAVAPAPAPRWQAWQIAAASAVAAVALWQLAAVPMFQDRGGYVTATGPAELAPTATVAFVPDASEAAIRALLIETAAHITGGPSAIGLWQLTFDSFEERDAAMARFADSPEIVETVQAD